MVNSEAGQGVWWGGHGEVLRRSRGDAAGVEVGTSLLDRFGRERGNHPRSPQPASSQLTGGQARCRLRSVGWGGGLVVVRAEENSVHGKGGQQVSSWCWSRSSRRISSRAPTGSVRTAGLTTRWPRCATSRLTRT